MEYSGKLHSKVEILFEKQRVQEKPGKYLLRDIVSQLEKIEEGEVKPKHWQGSV